MEIERTRPETARGPAEWFTGDVWLDAIDTGAPLPSRMRALSVHFSPGARTAWHRHPLGQVLHVIEGEGRVQSRGGPVAAIRAGDTVRFDPDEDHWHGAAPRTFMTHLALQEADDDGVSAHWGEHVTDDEYLADPA
ncbi:MAG TPA: cupin domain-containing protein [Solirubrobacterales bacterium]|jgi:quercetin dioxygenase-like cupin family protein|nr:cupin domain-containing protein [Solirubrobacterales bacterium]